MERTRQSVILDFSIWSDIIFATKHREDGYLTAAQFEVYAQIESDIGALGLPPPHLAIVLQAEPCVCLQRLEKSATRSKAHLPKVCLLLSSCTSSPPHALRALVASGRTARIAHARVAASKCRQSGRVPPVVEPPLPRSRDTHLPHLPTRALAARAPRASRHPLRAGALHAHRASYVAYTRIK